MARIGRKDQQGQRIVLTAFLMIRCRRTFWRSACGFSISPRQPIFSERRMLTNSKDRKWVNTGLWRTMILRLIRIRNYSGTTEAHEQRSTFKARSASTVVRSRRLKERELGVRGAEAAPYQVNRGRVGEKLREEGKRVRASITPHLI